MSVSYKSLPFFIAGLGAPVAAQKPNAAQMAAIDSIVRSHVLAHDVPAVTLVITRGDKTLR